MDHQRDSLIYFGTDEPVEVVRKFSAGALSLDVSDGTIRHLCWHGIEVVRGIACPVRNANWATYPSVLADENITQTSDEFEISQVRLVADGALRVALVFKGNSDGIFTAIVEMSAHREFITNRAGFTLLHPLRDVVGTSLSVIHPDGSVTPSHFPLMISPDQVASEISGLRHSANGIDVEIIFRGEVFEMEDQRNWSDASFKTYCRPLSLAIPYRLSAGEMQHQEIHTRFRGGPFSKSTTANIPSTDSLELKTSTERVPHIAVIVDDGAIPDHGAQNIAHLINPKILQLRVKPETALAVFESAKSMTAVNPAEIELEVIVPSNDDPEVSLKRVADDCKSASLAVARVLALPEAYLKSYQPTGPWPAGPTPQDLRQIARQAFPEAEIGGGVLTCFTELNRCRPQALTCDYVAHGSTAITHASDDRSVIENLEGLSHTYRSARSLAGGRDYRLGLVAIGMRSNPYGSGVMENARQSRVAMAGADPRQRGLFAAAWAVGATAATEGHNVSSLALSAFVGPFGAIYRRERWVQPLYQDSCAGKVYPIFHVVRFLSGMSGAARLSPMAIGKTVAGVASQERSRIRLVLANLGTEASRVRLPNRTEIRYLNSESFWPAIKSPEWLEASEPNYGSEASLQPFSVAFLNMPA